MKKIVKPLLTIILILHIYSINGQDCSPTLKEIYSFPEGSLFQYRTTIFYEAPAQDIIVDQYTIQDKGWNGDSLFYTIQGIRESFMYHCNNHNYSDTFRITFSDTILIIDSSAHFLNACDSQLVKVDYYKDYYSYVRITDSVKTIGGYDNLYEYNQNDSLVRIDDFLSFSITQVYKEGLGLLRKEEGDIMYWVTKECEGYIIDGDTSGIISDFSTSIPKQLSYISLEVYPTVLDKDKVLYIYTELDYDEIFVLSLNGEIYPINKIDKHAISLNNLPGGIYLIVFISDNYRITRKVIIP